VYYRPFIERAAEAAGVPLPRKSVEALDTFDRFANEADLRVEFTLNPGETLILNNFRVLHARDDFVDWPDKNKRRCLLRLWLDADWLPDPPPPHAGRRNPMSALL
jgi:alpha-ketoglutarate-dependent taurine dioxygenase